MNKMLKYVLPFFPAIRPRSTPGQRIAGQVLDDELAAAANLKAELDKIPVVVIHPLLQGQQAYKRGPSEAFPGGVIYVSEGMAASLTPALREHVHPMEWLQRETLNRRRESLLT